MLICRPETEALRFDENFVRNPGYLHYLEVLHWRSPNLVPTTGRGTLNVVLVVCALTVPGPNCRDCPVDVGIVSLSCVAGVLSRTHSAVPHNIIFEQLKTPASNLTQIV